MWITIQSLRPFVNISHESLAPFPEFHDLVPLSSFIYPIHGTPQEIGLRRLERRWNARRLRRIDSVEFQELLRRLEEASGDAQSGNYSIGSMVFFCGKMWRSYGKCMENGWIYENYVKRTGIYLGKFHHDRSLFSRTLGIMVNFGDIIPFYGRKIQVSELL